MGDTGPCGPSSELFWDFGPEFGPDGGPANPAAEDRFVEFWNLVFSSTSATPDGSLTDLPKRNIDTGAGLRADARPSSTARPSVFDTDELAALVDEAAVGHRSPPRRRTPRPTSRSSSSPTTPAR